MSAYCAEYVKERICETCLRFLFIVHLSGRGYFQGDQYERTGDYHDHQQGYPDATVKRIRVGGPLDRRVIRPLDEDSTPEK